jgi:hypothetical protein
MTGSAWATEAKAMKKAATASGLTKRPSIEDMNIMIYLRGEAIKYFIVVANVCPG